MANIYLSPSLQEFNPYVGGGNEEYYMNLVADAMEPYLRASGIDFSRNNPSSTLSQTIAQSNQGDYDLHVALHSIIAQNYRGIYYNPEDIATIPTTSLAEVRKTEAPAVLIETAFHDNPKDADWIRSNIDDIARSVSKSIAEYFGVPFVTP